MFRNEESYLLSLPIQSVTSEYTSSINTPDTIEHEEKPYTQKPYVSSDDVKKYVLRSSTEKNIRSSSNIVLKLSKTNKHKSDDHYDTSSKTAKHNIYVKKSIQNQQRERKKTEQNVERSKSSPIPIRRMNPTSSSQIIHRDLSFNELQSQLAKSLEIQDQLKQYVNNKIVKELEKGQIRITLLEFVRTQNSIENVDHYDDYMTKYDYVKVKVEPTVISIDQLSIDLKKYEEQYRYISQILIYLSTMNPPLTVIIAKSEIEVGLKSIYQDECINDEEEEAKGEEEGNKQIAISNQHSSTPSSSGGSKLMIQCIDYLSELSPVKVKKIIYHYTLIIDLALSPPKTQRRARSNPK